METKRLENLMCLQDFEILSGDSLVAVWSNKELTVTNSQLLPQFLKRVQNADLWLETRAVDSHRPNSRMLKKALQMKEQRISTDNLYQVLLISIMEAAMSVTTVLQTD